MDKEQIRIAEVLFEMGIDEEIIHAITGQKENKDKPETKE